MIAAAAGVAFGAFTLLNPSSSGSPDVSTVRAIVLAPADFPQGWKVVHSTNSDGGPASQALFGPPATHRAWIAAHPRCAPLLAAVHTAGTALKGEPSAAITSHFRQQVKLGGIWFVSSKVTLRSTNAEVASDQQAVRARLSDRVANSCLAGFVHGALMHGLPPGSTVTVGVSQPKMPILDGNPAGWTMSMHGYVTIHHIALPINYQIVEMGYGRTEIVFTTESGLAYLIAPLDRQLLNDLSSRAVASAT